MKRFVLKYIPGILALPALGMTALALTVPATFSPRNFNTQQVGYFRVHAKALGGGNFSVNGTICHVLTTATCSVKFGALPANAFLLRQTQQIITVWNSTTSDDVGVGTTTAGVNIKASADVETGSGAISSPAFVAGSSGTLLTSASPQSGSNGGYDLYMSYTFVGASAATTGELLYVLEYAAPNDGDCIATPMGSAPVSC